MASASSRVDAVFFMRAVIVEHLEQFSRDSPVIFGEAFSPRRPRREKSPAEINQNSPRDVVPPAIGLLFTHPIFQWLNSYEHFCPDDKFQNRGRYSEV